MVKKGSISSRRCFIRRLNLIVFITLALIMPGNVVAKTTPVLDKTKYHTWKEVDHYLKAIAKNRHLKDIVSLIPIGHTREGKPMKVLRISKKGILGSHPDTKPAAFIMGAHHAREHVSKEAVLALIDKLINGYGKTDAEGQAITYLINAGTFYLLPWVNPDGGMNQFLHNPEQRKTNYEVDEPQIGAADCDTCGDGNTDEDSPDIAFGDVGEFSDSGFEIIFGGNNIIGRHLQFWYENDDYTSPVLDQRVARVQPGFSPYTFNYEGNDPDGDGLFAPYSGEDWVGGTDPNRNYGEPLWGDCDNDEGCSHLSGAQTYSGPAPFSEPETAAVAAFLKAHPNIVSLESLHSGINEIYPPWYIHPDASDKSTMDLSYYDSVAQYISQETGYEVAYGGPYAVKGDTTGYSYVGSNQDPAHGLDFYAGGLLSFTTEIYGMGSDSGSAEAVRDWFPQHYQQFDTGYPQGIFLAWGDFPWCTTCDPEKMPGPLNIFNYLQYTEYFIFNSRDQCDGNDTPDIFHCDYWGIGDSTDYYADFDIFAYFNPPAVNRCYEDWNCDGSALTRTVDLQLKHLMYRLYIAPFIRVDSEQITSDDTSLNIAIENTGFLRSSVMTTGRQGEDSMENRYYDMGLVDVKIAYTSGFQVIGAKSINIGWLGGGRSDDLEPRSKSASFQVSGLNPGDLFLIKASSQKTGKTYAMIQAVTGDKTDALSFQVLWTNNVPRSKEVDTYFTGGSVLAAQRAPAMMRSKKQIQTDMQRTQQKRREWKQIEGPFDVLPGYSKGITFRKYH
ncbi:MAG: hypothetical protein GY710_00370 [Desulfobacteraceae bacterium]|nr:hypothetical protein [Desulfobacteraceae bacterium]